MKLIFSLFFTFLLVQAYSQSEFVSLKEAADANQIRATISGAWDGTERAYWDPTGQYYGKCIQMDISNLSDDSLHLFIPIGQMLNSADSTVQDMIITKEIKVSIQAHKSLLLDCYAMCAEYHDKMPNQRTRYAIGELADKHLRSIAESIDEMYMQNICGQGAIWAYTDSATDDDLMKYGADSKSLEITKSILTNAQVSTPLHQIHEDEPIDTTFNLEEVTEGIEAEESSEDITISNLIFYGIMAIGVLLIGIIARLWARNKALKK